MQSPPQLPALIQRAAQSVFALLQRLLGAFPVDAAIRECGGRSPPAGIEREINQAGAAEEQASEIRKLLLSSAFNS